MTLVVDASALVAALTHRGPDGPWVEFQLAGERLVGPEVAAAEATNILRRQELFGEISPAGAETARQDLLAANLELHSFAPFAERIWELRHNLTSYDAWYVAVAEWLACPLVTLDMRLSRASGPRCEFLTPPAA